jgi:hypothetical protein
MNNLQVPVRDPLDFGGAAYKTCAVVRHAHQTKTIIYNTRGQFRWLPKMGDSD